MLVAEPTLPDPNFSRSVVLVAHHDADGALGLVLNRPSETAVAEAAPELAGLCGERAVVHEGGPVAPRGLIVLAEFEQPEAAGLLVAGELDEALRELAGAREHREVPARDLVDLEPEALARDAGLEGEREQPVIAGHEHARRDVGPPLEGPRLAEHAGPRRSIEALVLPRHLGIDVEEDLREGLGPPRAHLAVTLEHVGDRLRVPRVLPPFSGGLARRGDHRREQNEPHDGHPGRNERTGERAEGLRHDDGLAGSGHRVGHGVGVIARSRLLIVERERRRDGVVAEGGQRLDGGAVHKRVGARAGDQYEGRHAGPRSSAWGMGVRR